MCLQLSRQEEGILLSIRMASVICVHFNQHVDNWVT
jgi:hypothetical protein